MGRRCFIDHGTGVVIGETAELGDDVTIYHGVTLGSKGWWTDGDRVDKRHPTLGDRVVVGTGASILGPVTVGRDSVVGAHALVLRDVPAGSVVRAPRSEVDARSGVDARSEVGARVGRPPEHQVVEFCI
ncbi:hypothetical protein J7S33_28425 [Saccharothrix algeriensis]|uniref:Serine O-acetyltransferase n=1 Tax=Saccharothrix algeriensis TaxID=173560 RepID=A0A8T8I6R9_9PSEU|nr:hypothetical protein J7S33_28425 [Saccharothrix algeriensis]